MLMKKIIALAMTVLVCAALAGCQKIGNDRGVLTVNVPEDYEWEEVYVFPYDIIELKDYVSVAGGESWKLRVVHPASGKLLCRGPAARFMDGDSGVPRRGGFLELVCAPLIY